MQGLAVCVGWCGKGYKKCNREGLQGRAFFATLAIIGVTGCKQKQNNRLKSINYVLFLISAWHRRVGMGHVRWPKNQRVFNIRRFYMTLQRAKGVI
jgi:hypothetical protein